MNPYTGEIHEGTSEEIEAIEAKLRHKLVSVSEEVAARVKAMTANDQRAFAKRRMKNRAKRARRKANRK